MKIGVMVWVLAVVVVAGLMAACSANVSQPPATAGPAASAATVVAVPSPGLVSDSGGAALVKERCTACHSIGRVQNARMSQAQWTTTVAQMVQRGAQLNADEQKTVVEYLAKTYGQ